MSKNIKKFKAEIILIIVTALIAGFFVNSLKKTKLKIPYPLTERLVADFNSLTCEQVSQTYMRAWSQGSDLVRSRTARIQLSLREEKTRKWESYYKNSDGSTVNNSVIKKATIILSLTNNKVIFTGDDLWSLENQPFDISINNQHRLVGVLAMSKEEPLRCDVAGTFMLDKNTGLLILSDTSATIAQNESFGSRSRLFTCRKLD